MIEPPDDRDTSFAPQGDLTRQNKALTDSLHKLSEVIDASEVGTWHWNIPENDVQVNERWAEIAGYARQELMPVTASRIFDLCHPQDAELARLQLQAHLEGDAAFFETQVRIRHKNGDWIWVLDRGRITERDANGKAVKMSGLRADISHRKAAEKGQKLAERVFMQAHEGILVTSADGKILDVNHAFQRITGYSREDILGQNPRILQSGQQDSLFYEHMWGAIKEHGYWSGEIWNRRKSGDIYAEHLTISAVYDDLGAVENYIGIFSDITTSKQNEKKLKKIAHFDLLTGLPNRVLLGDRLSQFIIQAQRKHTLVAICFIDLDGFKFINDTYGHEMGDEFLKQIARNMNEALRESDTLARFGGDEFVAVIPDLARQQDGLPVISRLFTAAAQPIDIRNLTLQVSASIGVCFYPLTQVTEPDQIIRQADQAMYQAKLRGKNQYHIFDSHLDQEIMGKHSALDLVRDALKAHWFELHYQPKVNLRTGEVLGVEALIRLNHPQRGLISPVEFIPAIEDHPLSIDVGEWVIQHALAQSAVWHAQGLDIPISVNISAHHLQQENFPERIRAFTPPSPRQIGDCLMIEVLETSALQDVARVIFNMQACVEMGIQFALDDFGTGYSSLAYLKKLPVIQIKIDQGFIRELFHDIDDLTITSGVINLARAYQMQCIAEGVETEEHCKILLRLGCETVQGFGIARPMRADRVREWIHDWKPDATWQRISPIPPHCYDLLVAETAHRHWLRHLIEYINGSNPAPPTLDTNLCDFGRWLNPFRQNHPAHRATLETLEATHESIHYHAERLLEKLNNTTIDDSAAQNLLQRIEEKSLLLLQGLGELSGG